MKFRKKPVVIEAYQTDKEVYIETLEGIMKGNPGDWIITGVNGEQYPCKPDIFEKTYEPATMIGEPKWTNTDMVRFAELVKDHFIGGGREVPITTLLTIWAEQQ